jgi:hypothetical protein
MDDTQFQIQFQQWRSTEYDITSFYLSSNESLHEEPLPMSLTRNLIDGDIIIENLVISQPIEQRKFVDILPKSISVAGKVMVGICSGIVILVIVLFLPWMWFDTIKKLIWKKKNLVEFRKYLMTINELSPTRTHLNNELKAFPSTINNYVEKPHMLPDRYWKGFNGKKADWSIDFDSKSIAVIMNIIMIFLFLSFLYSFLSILPI